jgi:hypothetical protein
MLLRAAMTRRTIVLVLGLAACSGSHGMNPAGGGDSGSNIGPGGDGSGSGSGSDMDGGVTDVQPTYPTTHPKIYLGANDARLTAALASGRAAPKRLKTVVDSWLGGTSYWGFDSWNAALVGQLTGDSKYCTAAIADVDAQVSAAETAIAGGSQPVVANDDYLGIGEMVGNLSLVYDWCFDAVTTSQRTRWLAYANQAVTNVWTPASAAWGSKAFPWTGWATNDPSDNYYYSFLRATMLLGLAEYGEDSHADAWLAQFRVTKVLDQLMPTFDSDLVGGGSREGTGYGVAMRTLFELYDIWSATTGEPIGALTPHTRASMLTMMHQIVPTLDRFAPTGDQSRDSTASMFDYQRNYLQELVHLYPTDTLAPRAQALLANCSVPAMQNSFMAVDDFVYENPDVDVGSMTGGTAYYAPGIGELYARSGWDTHATWINLIAGPYTESHAHQDQGALMIYKDGWLAYDAVVQSHSGLRQETTAHGIVRISSSGTPIAQVASTESQLVGLHAGSNWLYASADLTAAYNGAAAISNVQRELVFLEPDTIVVYDRVKSAASTQQAWSLASPNQWSVSGANASVTAGSHTLHVQRLAPAAATGSVFAYTSDASGDYTGGYRLDETVAGGDQRFLHVLSIDGAVSSATASDDSTVSVTLSNGQTAHVAFDRTGPGATLTYGGVTTTLDATVDTLAP